MEVNWSLRSSHFPIHQVVIGLHNIEMNTVDCCMLTGRLLKVHEVYWSQLLHQVCIIYINHVSCCYVCNSHSCIIFEYETGAWRKDHLTE